MLPSFVSNAIARYRHSWQTGYSPTHLFTALECVVYLSSPSIVSDEKSAIKHVVCLHVMSYFVLLLSRFSLAAITSSNIFFCQLPSAFSFSFSLSLSLSHCTCVDMLAIVTQISEALLTFLQCFWSFSSSDGMVSIGKFKFTDSCSFNLLYFSTLKLL